MPKAMAAAGAANPATSQTKSRKSMAFLMKVKGKDKRQHALRRPIL